jgi:hypothetical protein
MNPGFMRFKRIEGEIWTDPVKKDLKVKSGLMTGFAIFVELAWLFAPKTLCSCKIQH